MTQILRQSTAVDVLIGPFVDSTNGYTSEEGLSPAVELSKNGQALAAKTDATTPVVDDFGYYNCELDATDTNTVGTLVLAIEGSATALPVRHEFQVLGAVTYDAIYGASPTMITSDDVGIFHESTIGTVTSQTEFISDTAIVTDDNWNLNVITIKDVSTGEMVTRWVTDVIQSTDTIKINAACPFTVVANDIIRVKEAKHPRAELNDFDPATDTALSSARDAITAALLDYFQLALRSDAAIASDNSSALNLINANEGSGAGNFASTTDSLEATQDDLTTLTSVIGSATDTDIATDIANVQTAADAILVDTAVIGSATDTDIGTDIANVQTAADAIKAKTDSLTFTKASEIDANIQSVDDVTIGENGTGDQDFGEV